MGIQQIKHQQELARSIKGGQRASPITSTGLGQISTRTAVAVGPPPVAVGPSPEPVPSIKLTSPSLQRMLPKLPGRPAPLPPVNVRPAVIPEQGYYAIGKNDVDLLMAVKAEIEKARICSLDYEAKGDSEDEDNTNDPQDNQMVGASVCYKIGLAFYLPVAHDNYAANWDVNWLVANFLKPVLENQEITIVAHNVKYEHQLSLLHGIDMFPKSALRKIVDTLLLVKALAHPDTLAFDGRVIVGLKPSTKTFLANKTTGMIHSLLHVDSVKSFKDTVGTKKVPIPGEFYKSSGKYGKKGDQKMQEVQRTFNELPVDQITIDYGCSDADWALGLCLLLLPWCEREGIMEVIWELDIPNMVHVGEMELAGWHINRVGLEALGEVANKALDGILPKLNEALGEVTHGYADFDGDGNLLVPEGFYGMGTWRNNDVCLEIGSARPFNWKSAQHLQWLFYHVLKVSPSGIERSKVTGLPSCDKDSMDMIIERFEGDTAFVKLLKEKKKYDTILTTFVNGLLPYCRKDTDKVHTNFNLVATWRYSSKKPNLQNIPRADNDPIGIRCIFEAPFYDINADYSKQNIFTKPVYIITHRLSGHTFYVGADYSQIELKVLAWYAMEQAMIEVLKGGGDLHSWVAKEVFHLDCPIEEVKGRYKTQRYRSKKINFGDIAKKVKFMCLKTLPKL